jgi:nucleoside-triphosphatase
MANVYLLTGRPGTGKTTIIREALTRLSSSAGGFYTEEIRVAGDRLGFKIATLAGQSTILSHVGISGPHRVSKYGVDVNNLENTGVTAIYQAISDCDVIVIDEIGKMELLSPRFREAVLKAINTRKKVLGTIMLNPHPFADEIKRHPNVKVVQVSVDNRKHIMKEIIKWLTVSIDENNS